MKAMFECRQCDWDICVGCQDPRQRHQSAVAFGSNLLGMSVDVQRSSKTSTRSLKRPQRISSTPEILPSKRLPRDWIEIKQGGLTFYYNDKTKESTLPRPRRKHRRSASVHKT